MDSSEARVGALTGELEAQGDQLPTMQRFIAMVL